MPGVPADFFAVTEAHGILGSVAWVIFFPLGAITIHLMNGRYTFWTHVIIQSIALILFTISFGQGVWMAIKGMFSFADYHPAIGIVLFSFAWTQPLSGLSHHTLYKKKGGRTIISHLHIWIGRGIITLGIIQGGLGILYAGGEDASRNEIIAYGVIAALIWLTYVSIVVYDYINSRLNAREDNERPLPKEVSESAQISHNPSVESSIMHLNGPRQDSYAEYKS